MLRKLKSVMMFAVLQIPILVNCIAKEPVATTWYGVQWYYCQWTPEEPPVIKDLTYTLESDTIINETHYSKIMLSFDKGLTKGYSGAVRQSTDGLQVYYVPCGLPQQGSPTEYLLYNFDVKPGDVVNAYYGFSDYTCAELDERSALDSYSISDVQIIDGRKHVYVTGEFAGRIEWIEGVGTNFIIWPFGQPCMATGYSRLHCTLCAADSEGNILYSFNTDYIGIQNNCPDWVTTANENTTMDDTSATKLLRDGQLFIQNGDKTYNALGVPVK